MCGQVLRVINYYESHLRVIHLRQMTWYCRCKNVGNVTESIYAVDGYLCIHTNSWLYSEGVPFDQIILMLEELKSAFAFVGAI